MSGVSVTCLHFPQGLAYGILASLSPVQGLYTSFFPVLFYSIFGTCQHMAFGTDSIVAILTAEIIDTQANINFARNQSNVSGDVGNDVINESSVNYGNVHGISDEEFMAYKIVVSTSITFVCGVMLLLMGIAKLGCLTTFQSKSFIGGFTTAAAFHIFSSQVPKGLGIDIPLVKGVGKVVIMYKLIFERITETNIASLIVVIICCVILLFLKDFVNVRFKDKLRVPLPADLLTIILATIVSKFANIEKYQVEMVGNIPAGIPPPKLPEVSLFWAILPECFTMSLLIFFLSIAMVKVCTEKHEYEVNDNNELVAYGLTNIACSFFPCYPASTSPPRNMILSEMGARTTVNGLFTAAILLLVLFVLGQLFAALPVPALAAMIFVSVKPLLLQVRTLPKLYRVNVYDFIIWLSACLTGILLDLPYGLMFGIGTSFLIVIMQNQRVDAFALYQSPELIYVKKPDARKHSSIAVFKMYSPLYFATSEVFKKRLYAATLHPLHVRLDESDDSGSDVSDSNKKASEDKTEKIDLEEKGEKLTATDYVAQDVKVIILDCSCGTYIDVQGVNALSVVFEEYRRVGVTVLLAGCPPFMWKCLNRSNFFKVVSKERVFFEVDDAYQAAKSMID